MEQPRKVLAFYILKCSLQSCAFFQLLFPLPSRRTLQSLLNSTFGWALMPMCLVHLKTLYGKDKITCAFSCLTRCQTFGCIEGLEDLESHDRTSIIANNALVFILHGNQVVACYLIHGALNVRC